MPIVAHETESIHGDANGQRMIYYRFQDSQGEWHKWGPLITIDPDLDIDATRALIADKIEVRLADVEVDSLLRMPA